MAVTSDADLTGTISVAALAELGVLSTVMVDLTAAQIANQATSPPIFVPAPGVGKANLLLAAAALTTYGSTPFAEGSIGITYAGENDELLASSLQIFAAFNNAFSFAMAIGNGIQNALADIENRALIWRNGTNDPTPGANGTVRVWLFVATINLN